MLVNIDNIGISKYLKRAKFIFFWLVLGRYQQLRIIGAFTELYSLENKKLHITD